jgi:DNA-binding NtrC family response regulator
VAADNILSLHTLKHEYLRWILEQARGNKAEAARLLDIDRSSLYRLLKAGGLLPSDVRQDLPPSSLADPRAPLCEGGASSR